MTIKWKAAAVAARCLAGVLASDRLRRRRAAAAASGDERQRRRLLRPRRPPTSSVIADFQKTDAGKGVTFKDVLRRLRRPEPRRRRPA